MPDLELYPPDVDITPDLNLKIRIRILAQVILDLAQGCGGSDCERSIKRGIIDKPIIENITLSFIDNNNVVRGQVMFCIDWGKLEFLAQTNEGITVIERLDLNKLLAPQLDPELCSELFNFVKRLKKKYNIVRTRSSYGYRKRYRENDEILSKTRAYMGHEKGEILEKDTKDFNYELKVAFQGLDGYLDVIIRK